MQTKIVLIAGAGGTGKTQLSKSFVDSMQIHTDDFNSMEWSAASKEVSTRMSRCIGYVPLLVVEGIRSLYGMRKLIREYPGTMGFVSGVTIFFGTPDETSHPNTVSNQKTLLNEVSELLVTFGIGRPTVFLFAKGK
jgi:hypothetical protein